MMRPYDSATPVIPAAARRLLGNLVLAAAVAGGWAESACAQQGRPQAPSAAPATIPLLEPRPAEGNMPDTQWQTQREGPDREPIAGFLQSLQGTDSQIEVILGQGRLLTTKKPIATEQGQAVIAVGDPTVLDFEVLPNPRMIRLIGKRPGVTDLSITNADDQTYTFEVHVVYDLVLMTARMRQVYPDAEIKISQLRGHLVLEGQARNLAQASAIENAVRAYVSSLSVGTARGGAGAAVGLSGARAPAPDQPQQPDNAEPADNQASSQRRGSYTADVEPGQRGGGGTSGAGSFTVQVINLMRVPGVHQVMLQVKIGELNRTALREMGADWFVEWGQGNKIGTQIAGAATAIRGTEDTAAGIVGLGQNATAFGIFPSGNVEVVLRALRQNSVFTVLAEPNLMAMSGQRASFLAGGQFPVPVPQGAGGVTSNVTVQFKDFGVQLDFVPTVVDEETIRLQVAPEVSSIDESLGTTLVPGGDPVPGLSTRRVDTTVELRQGHTLALAGLLQVELEGRTGRIPGIGDLPYIGPFFSNNSHTRAEKELLVLVTPYLVHSMAPDEVPPLPGSEIQDPNDLEFYFLNRIEGRTGRNFRSTTAWDDPWHLVELLKLEQCYIQGPVGYSE